MRKLKQLAEFLCASLAFLFFLGGLFACFFLGGIAGLGYVGWQLLAPRRERRKNPSLVMVGHRCRRCRQPHSLPEKACQ